MANDSAPPGKAQKYAIVERERRFLLAGPPTAPSSEVVTITDRYLTGTRLRLRRMATSTEQGEEIFYKLTQKIPGPGSGPGLITTMYLNGREHQVFTALPAAVLHKTRHRRPPLVIDVFAGHLGGLVMAEAEFTTDEELAAFAPPPWVIAEVTDDARFSGGHLVTATRQALADALAAYGLRLPLRVAR